MGESSRQITDALLRVAADLGHGGTVSEYRVESGADGYAVTLRIYGALTEAGGAPVPPPQPPSRSPHTLPPPAEARPGPSHMTEVLAKEPRQVEDFLGRLASEFGVYELGGLKARHPFLHPTFYTFSFRDAAGGSHGFEYQIECSNHLDERYERLVREFESFFESRWAFAKFFESRRRGG